MLQRIKYLIKETERSAARFAAKIQISPPTLENYLQGRRKISLALVEAILSAFPDVSAEWLLRGSGSMLKSEYEPRGAVSVGGSVLMSNVGSSGAKIENAQHLANVMEQFSQLVDKFNSSVDVDKRVEELKSALSERNEEIARLHSIIDKLLTK